MDRRALAFTTAQEEGDRRAISGPWIIRESRTTNDWIHSSLGQQIPVKSSDDRNQGWMIQPQRHNTYSFYFTGNDGKNLYVSYKKGSNEVILQLAGQGGYENNFVISYDRGHVFHPASQPEKSLRNVDGVLAISAEATPWDFIPVSESPSNLAYRRFGNHTATIRDFGSSMYLENARIHPGLRVHAGKNPDAWELVQCSSNDWMIGIPDYGMFLSALGDDLVFAAKEPNRCKFKISHREQDRCGLVIFVFVPEQKYVSASSSGRLTLVREIGEATAFEVHIGNLNFV